MSQFIETARLTRKDFATSQDVRWCPGCGDYAILAAVQRFMPELGIARENIAWISGIGCSSRFPYYMNTYGFHTIHGRAPAVAMGVKLANPELSVWVATGDGDALSIGGNHMLHCLRRNVDINILLFNNRIYGLTKGQYSPTSEIGKVTKSTPQGSADFPVDPVTFALGSQASFVARAIDVDGELLNRVLHRAATHRGTSLVEIYQNCNVFNDGAFDSFAAKDKRGRATIEAQHGEPLLFADNELGLRLNPKTLGLEVVRVGQDGIELPDILVHDETNPTLAFLLAKMPYPQFPVAVGVLHRAERPTYDGLLREQKASLALKNPSPRRAQLDALLRSGGTWTVSG